MSLFGVLTVVFVVLKLTGVIAWGWWLVFLPFYGPWILFLLFMLTIGAIASGK